VAERVCVTQESFFPTARRGKATTAGGKLEVHRGIEQWRDEVSPAIIAGNYIKRAVRGGINRIVVKSQNEERKREKGGESTTTWGTF